MSACKVVWLNKRINFAKVCFVSLVWCFFQCRFFPNLKKNDLGSSPNDKIRLSWQGFLIDQLTKILKHPHDSFCLHFSGLCNMEILSAFAGGADNLRTSIILVYPLQSPVLFTFSVKAFTEVQNLTTSITLSLKEVFQKRFWMSQQLYLVFSQGKTHSKDLDRQEAM